MTEAVDILNDALGKIKAAALGMNDAFEKAGVEDEKAVAAYVELGTRIAAAMFMTAMSYRDVQRNKATLTALILDGCKRIEDAYWHRETMQ